MNFTQLSEIRIFDVASVGGIDLGAKAGTWLCRTPVSEHVWQISMLPTYKSNIPRELNALVPVAIDNRRGSF